MPFPPNQYLITSGAGRGVLSLRSDRIRTLEWVGRTLWWTPPLSVVASTAARVELLLIGEAINPLAPEQPNEAIVRSLTDGAADARTCLARLDVLSGRFVALVADDRELLVTHDACGLRQVWWSDLGGLVLSPPRPA